MISIIIPNLHSPLIAEVVAALERQTARAAVGQIIVVGQDRHGLVPATVQSIATPQPVSAARARNLGAAEATGEYLLFLDADCIAAPDLVERLLERCAAGQTVVGGAMSLAAESYWVLCDNLLSFHDVLVTAPSGAREYLPSFCLCLARAAFEQAGGFDERYNGASGEDMDLSLRLRAHGHALYFDPAAWVMHRPPRGSAWAIWRHQRAFGRGYYQLVRQNRLHASPLLTLPPPMRPVLLATSPALACKDVLGLFVRNPALRGCGRASPGMVWGRVGWYVGALAAARERSA